MTLAVFHETAGNLHPTPEVSPSSTWSLIRPGSLVATYRTAWAPYRVDAITADLPAFFELARHLRTRHAS